MVTVEVGQVQVALRIVAGRRAALSEGLAGQTVSARKRSTHAVVVTATGAADGTLPREFCRVPQTVAHQLPPVSATTAVASNASLISIISLCW